MDILNKNIVLVLNRNWQAINIRTPADAFCQMATNAATTNTSSTQPGHRFTRCCQRRLTRHRPWR